MASRDPRSIAAEAAFRARLLELGAELLEPDWLGSGARHHVKCRAAHDCYPTPGNVRSGWGFCKTCAGKDPAVTEARFRARLSELGCTPLYGSYCGRTKAHHARCAAGHDCYPTPANLQSGGSPCPVCSGRDRASAEARFRSRVAELGGTVVGEYRSALAKVHLRCAAGHDCHPRPADVRKGGICQLCSGRHPDIGEARFRVRLGELGAEALFEAWRGVGRPHRVRCDSGHECQPIPHNVLSGEGICRFCKGMTWDAFYVVTSATVVKFGITSGNPRPRLASHARAGLADVRLLATGLTGTTAPDTEAEVRRTLALAGEKPLRGREYFDISCLALVLDIAAGWLPAQSEPAA